MPPPRRKHPNIAISGVPGTGKTTLAQRLATKYPHFKRIDMGKEAETRECREEYDELLQTWVVDEDKLVDSLKPSLSTGGHIIDWIHADMWADTSLIDIVITLRTDNTILYDRLKARGYKDLKISQNIDAEIMDEIGGENEEAFVGEREEPDDIMVMQMSSDTEEDVERSLEAIGDLVDEWAKLNGKTGKSTP